MPSDPPVRRPRRKEPRVTEWAGYSKLRTGRIHVWCPRCHRKFSNSERGKYDPPRAVLVQTHCPKCGQGGKEASETFLDARGKEISWEECERVLTKVQTAEWKS